jgi:hypothetical protein
MESARFSAMFSYVGTADNTASYCVPAALDYRQTVCGGEEAIYDYIKWVGQAGAELLAQRLGTKVMHVVSDNAVESGHGHQNTTDLCEIRQCAMANVLLPLKVITTKNTPATTSSQPPPKSPDSSSDSILPIPIIAADLSTHASWLTSTLIKEYHIGVAVFVYSSQIWLRVSGQIYLEIADFERFAGVMIQALERLRKGESLGAKKRKDTL